MIKKLLKLNVVSEISRGISFPLVPGEWKADFWLDNESWVDLEPWED